MLTCDQARLLMHYGAEPGTPRQGLPELGFHLASCSACSALWTRSQCSADDSAAAARPAEYRMRASVTLFPGLRNSIAPAYNASRDDSDELLYALLTAESSEDRRSVYQPIAAPARGAAQDGDRRTSFSVADSSSGDHASAHQRSVQIVGYRTLLSNPNFRLLWLGQAVSTFGSLFTRIAIPIYVYNLTNSLSQLGLAAFSSLVAPLCFGLLAGALVDRWNRRRTMLAVNALSAVVMLTLMGVSLMELSLPIKLASLYGINFVMALLRELFNPARVAIFPEIVREEELLAANSLDQATTTFAELISYPVAGFALFYFGASVAFGIEALTFLLSAMLLWGVRTRVVPRSTDEHSSLLREIGTGLATIRRLPLVRAIVVLSLIVPAMLSLFNTLQLPYAVEAVGSTQAVGFPALEAMTALGFTLGVLAVGYWGQRLSRPSLLVIGLCGMGLAIFAQGSIPLVGSALGIESQAGSQNPWTALLFLALPCTLLVGAANSIVFTCIRTVLQEETPHNVLGRVASVVSVAAGLGFAGGALLTGLGQGRVALLIAALGVAVLFVGVMFHRWFRRNYVVTQAGQVLLQPGANVVNTTAMY